MELKSVVQSYAWGKVGDSSLVARLAGEEINPTTTYAELWMGTHPSGQSMVKANGKLLKEYLEENPALVGRFENWENNEGLPFLFKVLSINKALSIQVHPDKDMATLLHHNFPTIYRDPNHKPELAIALTNFRALCGFRPTAEIKDFCVTIPEMQMLIPTELLTCYKKTTDSDILKRMLYSLLTRTEEDVTKAVQEFCQRLEAADENIKTKYCYDLVMKLKEEFPGDCGIFVAFFLNDVHLAPGEAIYLPAGIPHAYLSGDCIECMASSDNVVRAGLTPKLKDVDTLLDILDYQSYTADGIKLKPEVISPFSTRYNPPIPDFGVMRVIIPSNESWLSPSHGSCQIFIVTAGEGTCVGECIQEIQPGSFRNLIQIKEKTECSIEKKREWKLKFGTIMFLPPNFQYIISSAHGELEIYFSYTNNELLFPDVALMVL